MTAVAARRQVTVRRLLRPASALLAAVALAIAALSWLAARSIVMPRRREPPRTPADLGLAYETIELVGGDGIRLAAWWIAAERPRATAVLVHGFRSSRDEMLEHAPYLHAAAFDVLLYDARACGLSEGDLATMGWLEATDLRAVLDQVAARTDGRPMVVMAHSLGAATAILEAADDPRPAAFVLEAPFTAIEDVIGRSFRHFTRPPLPAFPFAPLTVRLAEARVGQHRSAVRPIDVIGRLAPRPVLLITGQLDPFVLPSDARRLAAAAGRTCTWWPIEGAGHPGSQWDPYLTMAATYRERVLAFLDSALGA